MIKTKLILTIILFYCLLAAKSGFSQCGTHLKGIDSVSNNASIHVLFNDANHQLNVAGGFIKVNNSIVNSVFQWDGNNANNLGQGLTGGGGLVRVFMVYKNKTYMGGFFDEVDNQPGTANLAIWDGANWSGCPIGEPLGGDVYDMTIYHDTLFMCGQFWCFGSTSNVYQGIIATDGTGWYNVGAIPYVWVSALIAYNDRLYLGGYYGMMEYQGGVDWEQLPRGPAGRVTDMDVDTFNNFLYVGGEFSYISDTYDNGSYLEYTNDSVSCSGAYYDGFEWHYMGADLCNYAIYEQGVKFYHGEAYFGGIIDSLSNGLLAYNVARWNGTKWDTLSCKLNAEVQAFEVFRDTLFIGGNFTAADGTPADGIVKYFRPDTGCHYLQPLVLAVSDTFKINNFQPTIEVQFYNNNAYADGWDWDFDDGQAPAPVYTQNASHVFDTPGTYNVSVTVNHGSCTKTATRAITIINNTGLEDYSKESLQFKVFPNPTSGDIAVECTLPPDKTGELRTHHANGSWKNFIKLQSGFNHVDIPATELVAGVNLMSLFIEGKFAFCEKVIKQ